MNPLGAARGSTLRNVVIFHSLPGVAALTAGPKTAFRLMRGTKAARSVDLMAMSHQVEISSCPS